MDMKVIKLGERERTGRLFPLTVQPKLNSGTSPRASDATSQSRTASPPDPPPDTVYKGKSIRGKIRGKVCSHTPWPCYAGSADWGELGGIGPLVGDLLSLVRQYGPYCPCGRQEGPYSLSSHPQHFPQAHPAEGGHELHAFPKLDFQLRAQVPFVGSLARGP